MCFFNVDDIEGGEETSYLRSTGETVGDCELQRFHAATQQKQNAKRSTYHRANKFVPVCQKKWQKHTSAKWVVDAITSFSFWSQVKCSTVLLIMESWRRSCQMRLLLRGNLLLHPDSAKMWHNREMSYVLSLLRSEASTHKSFMATHRLKCSMIFSSRTFSGKFPTHKCLVSRTILCAPAPLSCRWVFPLSVSLCAKWKRSANFTPGKKRGKILGANHWLVVVTQCKPLDPRTLFDTLHC